MNNTYPPTIGEWYQQLPGWRKAIFNFLCRIDDVRAPGWCGYYRYAKKSV